jgi:hypothetical protein
MKQIPYAEEIGNSFGAIKAPVVGNREILGSIPPWGHRTEIKAGFLPSIKRGLEKRKSPFTDFEAIKTNCWRSIGFAFRNTSARAAVGRQAQGQV